MDGDAAMPAPARVAFPGISSRAYEHPADRSALTALRAVPGFDALLRTMAGVFSERRLRLLYLATAVRVGERQFRALHAIKQDAVRVLDLPDEPDLYVAQSPHTTAATLGLDRPFVVVSSGLVELLDEEELRVVVGHELGHALSGHALYSSVLFTLLRMSGLGGWLPLGSIGLRAVVQGLKEWSRKAELSCDRAGLLVAQDPAAAMRVHLKLAGGGRVGDMDLDAFLEQAQEYQSAGDARDGVIRMLNLLDSTHPFSAVRALELRRWVDSGEYQRILAGAYPRRADDPSASLVEELKAAARSYRESFAAANDPLARLVRDLADGAGSAGSWLADKLRGLGGPRDGNGGNGGDGGGQPL
jgi:Zn-dependent protease with chaperone function